MATNKRPRKKHNPRKHVYSTNPMIRYSTSEGELMKMRIYTHLQKFTTGDATQEDWEALLFRIKIGIGLGKNFEETTVISTEMAIGLDILGKCHEHFVRENSWFLEPEEIDSIRQCLNIVDDLQDKTTRKEQLPVFIAAKHDVDNMVIYENRT